MIAYCCRLWTWISDQTPWIDASLTIRTLLLTGRHWHVNSTAGHPRSSPAPLLPPSSALTERMLSGQSTKTNKVASDATTEACVVMSFACVERCSVALSPTGHRTGHRLAAYSGPFSLWDNYCRSALFVGLCVGLLCTIV